MTEMKKGKLYGVGVGPGDPELVTLKALRIINACHYIAHPGRTKEETYAYQIITPIADDLDKKEYLDCYVEMTKDRAVLDHNYNLSAEKIAAALDTGEDVAFITIGDPTLYATYMYVHQRVEAMGYEAELISGIPSFCAAAARMDVSLVERSEQLHVIPSSYQIEEALKLPGNKVLMKAASKMKEVKQKLMELDAQVYMVENCGMESEKIYRSAEEIDENAGYLSLILVKEKYEAGV